MKTLLLALFLSMACADGAVLVSGRQTLAGKQTISPMVVPVVPCLLIGDLHYSSGFPSNTTTVTISSNGPTLTLQLDFADLITAVETTYTIYFSVEGAGGMLVTNWIAQLFPRWADSANTLDSQFYGYSTGYLTGTSIFLLENGFVGAHDPNGDEVVYPDTTSSPIVTPVTKIWVLINLSVLEPNDPFGVYYLRLDWNNPP